MSKRFQLLSSIVAVAAIAATNQGLAQDAHGGHSMGMQMDQPATTQAAPAQVHGARSAHDMRDMSTSAPKLHELHMTSEQHVLAHTATIHAAMVALDIEPEENLARLREARDSFSEVLAGLRHGDDRLGLSGLRHPAVLDELTRVEGIWARYSVVVDRSLEGSDVTAQHIEAIAAIDPELHRALGKLVETAEYYSDQGRGFSILMPTIRQASSLHIVLKDLVSKFLLATHSDRTSVANLTRTAADFEHLLQALTHGDSDLRVLGAPTSDIAAQYAKIEIMWRECWSEISEMSASSRTGSTSITQMREHISDLVAEVDEVVNMYHYL